MIKKAKKASAQLWLKEYSVHSGYWILYTFLF